MNDLIAAAQAWIAQDPDPHTRAELQTVIDRGDRNDLEDRMHGLLQFGTAGLRGIVGAGSNRMNRAVVIRTSKGLADYLHDRYGDDLPGPIVIGRDARLSSPTFFEDAIAVFAAAGIPVRYWDGTTPTPLVAYATRVLGAVAGVVITASHNPADYNGYKVYDANAVQIVPPVDVAIADHIAAVDSAVDVPRIEQPFDHPDVQPVPDTMFDGYLHEIGEARTVTAPPADLDIVYTPLHGVGWRFLRDAMHRAGYDTVTPVPEQAEPDGHFPTTHFPNPEEPGALDLAVTLAEERDADLIIANDPDADRLAVAIPTPDGWEKLTGNQIGSLLGDYLLRHASSEPTPVVIESIVSSPMLHTIAQRFDAGFTQTLTGFKWIWNAALDLEAAGEGRFLFGYEEALGYSVSRAVRDKDGISAAVVFADLAAGAKAAGETILDRLEALYRTYGLWVSTQKSVVRPGTEGLAEIAAAMHLLEERVPDELAGLKVVDSEDFRTGAEDRPRWLGATPLVALHLEDGGRVLIRPSGTEPKLKIYVDLRADLEGRDVSTAEKELLALANRIADDAAQFVGLT